MTDLWHWQHLNNYYICAISCMKCIHLYYIFDTNIYDSHFTRTSKFPDFLEPYFPQFFSPNENNGGKFDETFWMIFAHCGERG